ncbi:MAG: hypothetical protein ACK4V1_09990, partial [Burkholderiaceae bacterium]
AADRRVPQEAPDAGDAARFEQQRRELLAKLKMTDRGTPQPPAASSADALRALACAAGWALSAARAAGGGALDAARRDAQHGTGDCPPAPTGPIPIPTPALDDAPPDAAIYRDIIEQARDIQSRLANNRETIEATRARHARSEQALAQLKRIAGTEARDDDAQRRAQEALAAVERLERELARLDAQLAQSEREQQQLAHQLEALERRYEAAQARSAPATPEAGK